MAANIYIKDCKTTPEWEIFASLHGLCREGTLYRDDIHTLFPSPPGVVQILPSRAYCGNHGPVVLQYPTGEIDERTLLPRKGTKAYELMTALVHETGGRADFNPVNDRHEENRKIAAGVLRNTRKAA